MAASASAAPEPPWAAASGLGALRRERLLGYVEFEARDLARRFPPSISNGNKLLVAQIAAPKGADSVAEGLVRFARWRRVPLPPRFPDAGDLALAHVVGPFAYEPPREGESVWHLNFADTSLFGFYGGSLLAQDELQVAEHPLLASLREALHHRGEMSTAPRTRDGEEETPCLVMNAPRMCRFDLQPAPRLGLPYGIYGRAFAAATEAQVRALVARVEPPTSSNILAIVAPQGRGVYTAAQVSYVLSAAFSGFVAARAESERAAALERWPAAPRVTIHTGDWGAGQRWRRVVVWRRGVRAAPRSTKGPLQARSAATSC
jgi:hypothetical protein